KNVARRGRITARVTGYGLGVAGLGNCTRAPAHPPPAASVVRRPLTVTRSNRRSILTPRQRSRVPPRLRPSLSTTYRSLRNPIPSSSVGALSGIRPFVHCGPPRSLRPRPRRLLARACLHHWLLR